MKDNNSNVYLGTLFDSILLNNGDYSEQGAFKILFKKPNELKVVDGKTYSIYQHALGNDLFYINEDGKVIKHNINVPLSVKRLNLSLEDIITVEDMRIKLLKLMENIKTLNLEGRELYTDISIDTFRILRSILMCDDEKTLKKLLLEEYENLRQYYILAIEGNKDNLIELIENEYKEANEEISATNEHVRVLRLVPKD